MFIGSDALRTPAEAWNASITGVTGGYIIGFVVAAGVSGYLSQIGFIRSSSLWAIALGGLLLYAPALIWLANIDFGWPAEGKLFVDGMYIYMPGDITKILATSLAVTVLWNHGDRIIDVVRRRARELLGRGLLLLVRGGRRSVAFCATGTWWSSPAGRFGDRSNLVRQRIRELAPSQVALPEALHIASSVGQVPGTRVFGVGIDQDDP